MPRDRDAISSAPSSTYQVFWGSTGRAYHPETPDFAQRIKGMTLTQIYDAWFSRQTELQAEITRRLNEFEGGMRYNYIKGFEPFIRQLKQAGVKTAIVTSSNDEKMQSVFRARPELKTLFDRILTSEDYTASKPDPDCYLTAAGLFGMQPTDCVVFEDSVNGLKSGRASGAFVVGLTTTNPQEVVAPLADFTIRDFTELSLPLLSSCRPS